MMGWKYVMFQNKLKYYPIIFPSDLVHVELATVVRLIIPVIDKVQPMPVSAGVVEQLYVRDVGGDSETLKMSSDSGDEDIINRYKYFHGIR
jgi:hypothetical protein